MMATNKGKIIISYWKLILLLLCSLSECEAAARLIRLPLERTTTESAGELGQPVVNYLTTVQVGNPPISFQIQFDLGAQEHFVPHYSWNPFNRNLHYSKGFQCKSSSTCKKDDRIVSIEYQNVQLEGKRYEDQMVLVNMLPSGQIMLMNSTNLNTTTTTTAAVSWRQNFLAISSASSGRFSSLPIDGFFGLAPAAQSMGSLKNILISLHEAKQIDNLQFSIWFNPVLDSRQGGELILGGVDPGRYQGQIYWHHLDALNYNSWALNLQFVSLGSQIVSCGGGGAPCKARFSSGHSDIYGPSEDVKHIYSLLNTSHQSSGLELIDCRRIGQLPTLTFTIDGIPYAMLASNYIRKTVDGKIFKRETCYVAILAGDSHEWTLGTNFLGAYYSIYDLTYRQVGFAALR